MVWYSWKENIPIPICPLQLLPWCPLQYLPDPCVEPVQVTGGFLLALQSIQESSGVRAGKRVRPVPGERGIRAGMPLLAGVSWACRTELHPTTLPFWTFPFLLISICSWLWFLDVSFSALTWFASLGYSWFGLPRTLLNAHFTCVTCGEDGRRDRIFPRLRCVLSWWVTTGFMLLPSIPP